MSEYTEQLTKILIQLENFVEFSTVARINGKTYNNRQAHAKAIAAINRLILQARREELRLAKARHIRRDSEGTDLRLVYLDQQIKEMENGN